MAERRQEMGWKEGEKRLGLRGGEEGKKEG